MTDLHTRLENLWHTTHSLATMATMLGVTEREVRQLASASRLPFSPRMSIGNANESDRLEITNDYLHDVPNLHMQARYHLSAAQMLRIPGQLGLPTRSYVMTDGQREKLESLFRVETSLADIAKRIKLPVDTLRHWYEARLLAQKAARPVKTVEPLPFGKFATEAQMREAADCWGRMSKAEVAAAIGMSLAELTTAVTSVQRLHRLFPRAAYRRMQPAYPLREDVAAAHALAPETEGVYRQPAHWYNVAWLVPTVADCFGYPLASVSRAATLLGNRVFYGGVELFALLAMTQWLEEGACPLHTLFQSLHIVSTSGTTSTTPTSGVATDALLKTPVLSYQIRKVTRSDARRLRHVVSVDFCLLRTVGNLCPSATRTPLGVVPAGVRVVLAELG
jgi:hypothetical protein